MRYFRFKENSVFHRLNIDCSIYEEIDRVDLSFHIIKDVKFNENIGAVKSILEKNAIEFNSSFARIRADFFRTAIDILFRAKFISKSDRSSIEKNIKFIERRLELREKVSNQISSAQHGILNEMFFEMYCEEILDYTNSARDAFKSFLLIFDYGMKWHEIDASRSTLADRLYRSKIECSPDKRQELFAAIHALSMVFHGEANIEGALLQSGKSLPSLGIIRQALVDKIKEFFIKKYDLDPVRKFWLFLELNINVKAHETVSYGFTNAGLFDWVATTSDASPLYLAFSERVRFTADISPWVLSCIKIRMDINSITLKTFFDITQKTLAEAGIEFSEVRELFLSKRSKTFYLDCKEEEPERKKAIERLLHSTNTSYSEIWRSQLNSKEKEVAGNKFRHEIQSFEQLDSFVQRVLAISCSPEGISRNNLVQRFKERAVLAYLDRGKSFEMEYASLVKSIDLNAFERFDAFVLRIMNLRLDGGAVPEKEANINAIKEKAFSFYKEDGISFDEKLRIVQTEISESDLDLIEKEVSETKVFSSQLIPVAMQNNNNARPSVFAENHKRTPSLSKSEQEETDEQDSSRENEPRF